MASRPSRARAASSTARASSGGSDIERFCRYVILPMVVHPIGKVTPMEWNGNCLL